MVGFGVAHVVLVWDIFSYYDEMNDACEYMPEGVVHPCKETLEHVAQQSLFVPNHAEDDELTLAACLRFAW